MISISGGADNWNLIWQINIPASTLPLVRQNSPTILTSPVVLCQFNLVGGFHTNKLGGYLNQHVRTGIPGANEARVSGGKRLFVDQNQIIIFDLAIDYHLSFDLLTYIASAGQLTVFEYTGGIS